MPPGWKPCQTTYRTVPPPRRCRRSATSTSLNSRPSFRRAASAEIDPRNVRSRRAILNGPREASDLRETALQQPAFAPAAQPRPASPGRTLPVLRAPKQADFNLKRGLILDADHGLLFG